MQALDAGLMGALLGVMNNVADLATSAVRNNPDHQELISVLVSTLAQLTIDADKRFAQKAVKESGIISLCNLYSKVSKEGGQQNVVSMLWHWSTLDPDIRQQVIDAGAVKSPCNHSTGCCKSCAYIIRLRVWSAMPAPARTLVIISIITRMQMGFCT